VGVALSDTEASVVSPFTGRNKSAMDVVEVLKEGRCGLSSAFSSYKYMIMYGQVETINQIVNAYFKVTFSEWCWVFLDGFWVVTMAFSLPFAPRNDKLSNRRPPSSLLGAYTMSSTLGVLAINFAFLCGGLGLLNAQSWYSCRKWTAGAVDSAVTIGDNYESSVIFLITGAQYVTSAMAYNFGPEHRGAWWTNWRFVGFLIVYIIIHIYIILVPSKLSCFFRINCQDPNLLRSATNEDINPIQNPWNTSVMPEAFRGMLVILIVWNTVSIMAWERVVVLGPVGQWFRSWNRETKHLRQ